jgi:phasin family protein
MDTSLKSSTGTETAQLLASDINEGTRAAFEKTAKLGDELIDLNKGNVEALVASARVAGGGAETLTRIAADYSKQSFDTATAALKGFASAKSPTELFQLQTDYARTTIDSTLAAATKFSEAWVNIAGESFKPLSSQYAADVQKIRSAQL